MSASVAGRDRIAANAVVLLCFASGATDVLSYVTLGQIFTSAMTGAAALFFINLAGGDIDAAARAAIALASFVVGAAIAAAIQPRDPVRARADRPLCLLLGIEVVLLGIYSGLSIAAGGAPQSTLRYGLIVLSALSMGMQAVVARDIHEPGINTVVLNLTLTSIAVALSHWLTARRPEQLPGSSGLQMTVVGGYAAGAAATAFDLLVVGGQGIQLLPFVAVLVTFGLYLWRWRSGRG